MEPMVSICCAAYNHAPYIARALDGFLSQKTSFPVEILINDDASTDGTPEMIRQYAEKYPDVMYCGYRQLQGRCGTSLEPARGPGRRLHPQEGG